MKAKINLKVTNAFLEFNSLGNLSVVMILADDKGLYRETLLLNTAPNSDLSKFLFSNGLTLIKYKPALETILNLIDQIKSKGLVKVEQSVFDYKINYEKIR